jgi:ABC-type multidrug transport system fused ATPase/permease subunit
MQQSGGDMAATGSRGLHRLAERARARVRNTLALLRLLSFLSKGRATLLVSSVLVATLLPSATAVAIGVLVARLNERAGTNEGIGGLVPILLVVGVLLIADLVAQTLITPIRERVAVEINGRIRQRTRRALLAFDSIEHLDDQEMRAAAELPVYDEGLFSIGQAVESQLWIAAKYVGAIAAGLLVASFSPFLAVLAFALMLVQRSILHDQYNAFGTDLATMIDAKRQEQYWRSVVDSSTGGKELRLFQFHDHLFGRFAEAQEVRAEFHEGIMRRAIPGQWKPFVLTAVAVGSICILSTRAALAGDLEIARLTVVLGATLVLSQLGQFGFEWLSIDAAGPQLAGLAVLESHTDPAPNRESASPEPTPRVAFDHVTFRYPGSDEDVLTDVSFELEPGELVAIVGENGAGKTTLLNLLAGFYTPTGGRILVDGVDLEDISMSGWRTRIGLISQHFVHYELSALDNVALGSLSSPSQPDAELAALAAGAENLITALPAGWDTVLSRRLSDGVELSGGEWQRVALARALYASSCGSSVLILDEPTANLDVDAEVALFDQLLEHALGATAIVVSHRFSTVRRAQRILVIDDGRLVEDGPHAELLAQRGTYCRLYTLQAERFRSEPTPGDEEAGR